MKVYELLDSPEKWTKSALARTKDGNGCWPTDNSVGEPACWCIGGALMRCYPEGRRDNYKAQMDALGFNSWMQMVYWNNDHSLTYENFIQKVKEADV